VTARRARAAATGEGTHEHTPRRRRRYTPFRMWQEAYDAIHALAVTETEGDMSRMIRKLLAEAMSYRQTPCTCRRRTAA